MFCNACLCSDRTLSTLGEYNDIYMKICENSYAIPQKQIYLCWECIALLNRIKQFKKKVDLAQKHLKLCWTNKKDPYPSLSNLTKTRNETIVYLRYEEEFKPLYEEEFKPLEIKIETDDSSILDVDYDNTPCLYNIKQELEIVKEEIEIVKEELEIVKEDCDEQTPANINEIIDTKVNVKCEIEGSIQTGNIESKPTSGVKNYRWMYTVPRKELIKKIPIAFSDVKPLMMSDNINKCYRYKCDNCVDGWKSHRKLIDHMAKFHNENNKQYICDICSSSFNGKCSLKKHIKKHSYMQECGVCGHRCYNYKLMRSHVKCHKQVKCIYCGLITKNRFMFYKHYNSEHGCFICDHCGKKCKTRYMIEKHMRCHYAINECEVCHMRFKTKSILRRHHDMKHAVTRTENEYCAPCNRQFETVAAYRHHVQVSVAHAHERKVRIKKKVPCPDCGILYTKRSYMMNHYRYVHIKQSKYYCTECDKPFLNRTRYVDHVKYKHEGMKKEKNKVCNICGKGFTDNRILENHTRTHSGERPFECPHCTRRFTQKYSMLSHVKHIHQKIEGKLG